MFAVPFAVWRLMIAYALMMGGTALTVLIAGIVGARIAPSEGLATLPIALAVVGVASATLPTGRLLGRFGRRRVFLAYGGLAIGAALVSGWSLVAASFPVYCLGAYLMGWAAAASHQYRFAALELVPPAQAARATSVLLLGGILGALVGPEMAVRGRFLLSTEFAGSYLLLIAGYLAGLGLIAFYREHPGQAGQPRTGGRPTHEILRQPVILVAVTAAATAYGVMSFIMTATPLSMHSHAGHDLEATKWVLQSHIAAMYLPSLVFAPLLARLGYRRVLAAGLLSLAGAVAVALHGLTLSHYWLSLVLLGVGWNFLFLAGTNLLAHGHRAEERYRVQSANDFVAFTTQALVSLGSGWFLFRFGWDGLLWTAALPVLAFAVLLIRSGAFRELGAVAAGGEGRI